MTELSGRQVLAIWVARAIVGATAILGTSFVLGLAWRTFDIVSGR